MSDGIRSGVNWMRLNFEIDGLRELLDEERLGQAGDAAQQAVAAGEKRDQDLADDALLADDGLRQLALEPAGHFGDALERQSPARRAAVAARVGCASISHAVDDSHRLESTTARRECDRLAV